MAATFSLRELAKAVGVTTHTIRGWVKGGVLPTTTPRGPATVYEEHHYERALAVKQLRKSGMSLAAIKSRLESLTEYERLELAGLAPPPPPLEPMAAPAPSPAPAAAPAVTPAPAPAAAPYRFGVGRPRHLCEVLELCPGVSLLVRADADTEAQRVARAIAHQYGAID